MKKLIAISALTLCLVLTGCNMSGGASQSSSENSNDMAESSSLTNAESASAKSSDSDMFTDRDREIGYDENESVKITLNGDSAQSSDNSVSISGSTVTIKSEGTYILSGQLNNGMVCVEAQDADKIQLVLDNANITNSSSAAIYVKTVDKVFITTAKDSQNTLSSKGEFKAIDENNIDSAVFSKEDLTLNGAGTLNINCDCGHGVVSKDDLVVTCGSYNITAASHGLSGKDSVRIGGGEYNITAGKDGIHSSNDEDEKKGFTYIAGGNITINAEDDGVHADSALTITDGTINVKQSYEGLEGSAIDISGGDISVVSSDDGINAAGGNDQSGFGGGRMEPDSFADSAVSITISAGTVHVNAEGDGIDSNGSLTVSGGNIFVEGPQSGGNGALDYNGEAVISGGTLVALGSSQMAQNFGENSTQGTMLVNTGASQTGEVTLNDSNGNALVSVSTEKQFETVVISCPDIKSGSTYTLVTNSGETQVTMDSLVYGSGGGFGGMKNPGGRGGDMGGNMDRAPKAPPM